MDTEDQSILENLFRSRQLSLVPAGDNDDIYIISYAHERNGYVVSNDQFRNHFEDVEDGGIQEAMFEWILSHRCGFTFVQDEFVLNADSTLSILIKSLPEDIQCAEGSYDYDKMVGRGPFSYDEYDNSDDDQNDDDYDEDGDGDDYDENDDGDCDGDGYGYDEDNDDGFDDL